MSPVLEERALFSTRNDFTFETSMPDDNLAGDDMLGAHASISPPGGVVNNIVDNLATSLYRGCRARLLNWRTAK
jgi:hypothetical protein